MYDDYQEHIEDIAETFEDWMAHKYEAGAKEHGGNLWEMRQDDLLDNAIDEAIDLFVYLYTLKKQREADLSVPTEDRE